ncbi:ankyrin repeat domain-containing protein 45-like [Polyodon spathula]|uniref:ankyrin repeat domain-containing protein 45-like n=1 Tax=Polyodon spathula TaxID=7913 RepID=UPI001B7EC8E7|nr:ankyrin repeat domain-containing protein 45-like [Polyodon spathula]XP_041098067.1 ankyrin repeat domain-containing protein 45-like [Polyodon spathula]
MEPEDTNPVLACALSGDTEGLQKWFENPEDPHHEQVSQMVQETDAVGRRVLFTACMLGRSDVVRELVKYGSDVNETTLRGYSPLHCAAIWGQLECLKTLVELGYNIQALNFLGERAREVACRYSKTDCVEFLDLAEAKQSLQMLISHIRDTIADPEKVQGKLNKEDKHTCLNTCLMKLDWIQEAKDPTIGEFLEQKKQLQDTLNPILSKLTVPAPEPPLKGTKS